MILLRWLLSAIIIMLVSYLVPGIHVANFYTALLVALLLGLVNAIVRPILIILTLPITVLSLGLFLLFINAFLILFVSTVVKGFVVDGFGAALIAGLLLWLLNWAVNGMFSKEKTRVA
ncbi:MAG: phage holin family protein [Candidatus Kerfeldbacteria bacterium]|nr:phage holin family protein [Candidatus Kerfeldbacteria bacterium]